MKKEKSISTLLPVLDEPQVPPTALKSETSTVEALERQSRKLRKSGEEYTPHFASLELLLDAVREKRLHWSQVALLLRDRIDLGALYEEFEHDLYGRLEAGDYDYTDRDDFVSFLMINEDAVESYLALVDDITRAAVETTKGFPRRRQRCLWSKDRRGWACELHVTGTAFSRHQKVASAYEASLLRGEEFHKDLADLQQSIRDNSEARFIDPENWMFTLSHLRLYTRLEALVVSQFTSQQECIPTLLWDTASFCHAWGIEALSTDPKGGMLEGINIRCSRIEISEDTWRGGLNVFIPAHYRFSHIQNYKDQDFAELRETMDSSSCLFSVPVLRKKTGEAPVDLARRRWKQLVKEGTSTIRVWDVVRREMGWSETYMKRRFGAARKSGIDDFGKDEV